MRTLLEAFFSRYKHVIGDSLRFQTDDRQQTEIGIAVLVLNRMFDLRVCPERLFPDEAPEHQPDHSDADEGNGGAEVLLVMAYEAAAAREP